MVGLQSGVNFGVASDFNNTLFLNQIVSLLAINWKYNCLYINKKNMKSLKEHLVWNTRSS
jgi:hypothetical protein